MRFITEFELTKEDLRVAKTQNENILHRKEIFLTDLGKKIGESFRWQNPVSQNINKYRIEIEAFPMDKWIEFKRKLFDHITDTSWDISPNHIQTLINELESFGETTNRN